MTDPYDAIPYTDQAYAEAHPDRLAVVAKLSGWEPPALEGARVLELGCGRGGTLLPMAAGLRRATFVGFDASGRQVDEARRIARETGLTNVTFEHASFEAPLPSGGFDFVVCHGVYSWVSIEARHTLLRRVFEALSPRGVAYVSFNALPGWYARMPARDWLRIASGASEGSPEALRKSLEWLARQVSPELGAYRSDLERVLARLAETDPAYWIHEYLARENHPELVATFLGEAEAAGLAYLGDAIPSDTALELLPDAVAERAHGLEPPAAQQVIDFVRCAPFRRALLVRQDSRDGFRPPARLLLRAVESLRVASRLRPHAPPDEASPELWDGPQGSVLVPDLAARQALLQLRQAAPASMPFAELLQMVSERLGSPPARLRDRLAAEIFDLWLATGGVDLHTFEPPLDAALAPRPRACPVARWHAIHGGAITNLWHQDVRFAEVLVRQVLARADGTRDRRAIAAELTALGPLSGRPLAEAEGLVGASFELLRASALLTRD